jgi:hypothetical protein
MLLEGLKRKGSGFHREGKRQWEHAVKSSETIAELRDCLVSLEEIVHATQVEEDEIDSKDTKNKREVMLSDGWIFDRLESVLATDDGATTSAGAGAEEEEEEGAEEAKKVLRETRLQLQELEAAARGAEQEQAACEAEMQASGSTSKSKLSSLAKKSQKAEEAKQALDEVCVRGSGC